MSNSEILQDEPLLEVSTATKFSDFDIPDFLVKSLERASIMHPSPVQERSLPFSLKGQDILASAQTGTGKTLAFLLPIVTRMLSSPESNALILAPTRELAVQVKDAAFKLLPKGSEIKTIALIGGDSITKQFFQLKGFEEGAIRPKRQEGRFVKGSRNNFEKPAGGNGIHKNLIIVGTPGRIKDHVNRGNIKLDKVDFLVLDETDRMLDLGFKDTIEEIFEHLPQEKQTFMFSATMPMKIVSMSKNYLTNPVRIDIEKKAENAPKIKQELLKYSYSNKLNVLVKFLNENDGTAIVFVKTKMGAEELSAKLESEGTKVMAIHGDLKQRERDFVIRSFKANDIRIMVATDVAARGLHISHIQFVINYDLPQSKEDYIHRIGRTGRAGSEGNAISLVNEDDKREIRVATSYMRTNDNIDDEDEDVKSFGRDYARKKRSFTSAFGGGGGSSRNGKFGARRDFGGDAKRDFSSGGDTRRDFGTGFPPNKSFSDKFSGGRKDARKFNNKKNSDDY